MFLARQIRVTTLPRNLSPSSHSHLYFSSSSSSFSPSIQDFVSQRVGVDEYRDALRVCDQKFDQQTLTWTLGELNHFSNACARGILSSRVKEKGRLVVSLPNDAENVVTGIAANRVGVTLCSLPPDATPQSLHNCFESTSPRAVLTSDQYRGEWRTKVIRDIIPELHLAPEEEILRCRQYPSIKSVYHTGPDYSVGFSQFRDILVKNPLIDPLNKVSVSSDSTSVLVDYQNSFIGFTQGSIVSAAEAFAHGAGLTPDDRVSVNLSLSTLVGKTAGIFGVLSNLSMIVIPGSDFQPEKTFDSIENDSCNVLLVTPSQLDTLLSDERVGSSKLETLEKLLVVSEDGTVPSADLLERAKSTLKVNEIRVAIGTNCALPFLRSGSGDPLNFVPAENAKLQVTDDKGKSVSGRGELRLSGPYTYSTRWVGGVEESVTGFNSTGLEGSIEKDGSVRL